MTRKPRLLDLFCGAGGAAKGYQRAGFHVVGVDNRAQPHYCGDEFHQGDAMTWPLEGFDAIHASPPCQAYTAVSNRWRNTGGVADSHPDLVAPVRKRLEDSGLPWVMENVVGAPMPNRFVLRGGMFGLGVDRPRLFESNVLVMLPSGAPVRDAVGVYGDGPDGRRLTGKPRADGTHQYAAASLEEGSSAMGIDWMEWGELKLAIPPAYTEFIGEQILRVVATTAVAL